jgi:hypothetical protein
MARKVFFSFHFKRDAWRAGQVRNSDLLADEDEYGVIDAAEWEKIEKEGDAAVQRWINDQLKNTSVTVVLIGAETAERDWIDYEIRRSWERGNALLGVRIDKVKDQHGKTDTAGPNPLDNIRLTNGEALSSIFKTYDWVSDDGRNHLGDWVEDAYKIRKGCGDESLASETEKAETIRRPSTITRPAAPWAS